MRIRNIIISSVLLFIFVVLFYFVHYYESHSIFYFYSVRIKNIENDLIGPMFFIFANLIVLGIFIISFLKLKTLIYQIASSSLFFILISLFDHSMLIVQQIKILYYVLLFILLVYIINNFIKDIYKIDFKITEWNLRNKITMILSSLILVVFILLFYILKVNNTISIINNYLSRIKLLSSTYLDDLIIFISMNLLIIYLFIISLYNKNNNSILKIVSINLLVINISNFNYIYIYYFHPIRSSVPMNRTDLVSILFYILIGLELLQVINSFINYSKLTIKKITKEKV